MKTEIYAAERKTAERALHESEQRYKWLLASMTDYIYNVVVENGRSVKTAHGAGSAALTGYTPAEYDADPQLWFRIVPADDQASVLAHVTKVLQGLTPPALEHRITHKDGTIRWIRNMSVPHKDEQGRVVAYDGVICDITDKKLAEHRLNQASAELQETQDRLRETLGQLEASHRKFRTSELEFIQAGKMGAVGALTATVAHEVKNPLQTILAGLDYLASHTPAGNGGAVVALDSMRAAVTRANEIIRELLEFSGTGEPNMIDEDLNAIIERSLQLMKYELTSSRINLQRHLATDLPLLQAQRGKLEQVFLNLFINAAQAMAPGGTLTVGTQAARWDDSLLTHKGTPAQFETGERIVIAEVLDTGSGIAKENLHKLFEPFFTTKGTVGGTGLGLSVIKKIVDLHGGSVQIENAPQRGVKVTLVFKLRRDTAPTSEQRTPAAATPEGGQGAP